VKTSTQRILRAGLGGLLLATGTGKALDVTGFAGVLATYRLGIPADALWPLALAIAVLEIFLGLWILAGWRVGPALRLSIALDAVYFVVLESALVRGLALTNCGCFGVYLASPLRWYTPLEEILLVTLAVWLLRLDRDSARGSAARTDRSTGTGHAPDGS